ncbi:MAG: NHLP bacteriocin system secretion protein [Candidatus Muiribacteriota bacterium]
MNNFLYRKKALERLQSPDELDQMVTVISPKGWIALIAAGFFIILSIIWGVFGELPYRVEGKGLLMKSGGIQTVHHISSGKISDVRVFENDIVKKGDVIARLEQRDILQKINGLKKDLSIYEEELQKLEELEIERDVVESKINSQTLDNLHSQINSLQTKLTFLKQQRDSQEELLKDGIITRQMLTETALQINDTENKINQLENRIKELDLEGISTEKQKIQEISKINENIRNMEEEIAYLQEEFYKNSRVISPYNGRVIEVSIDKNDLINPGESIIKIERTGKDIKELVAVGFVKAEDGKKIKHGMGAQVSPSTVRKEEYGNILAHVVGVSEYPVSTEEMYKTVGNETLIHSLLELGPLIAVHADLKVDSKTPSGYEWTSDEGPPHEIFSGTICDITVTIKKERPISLVIPGLKRFLGL